jgi:hypothetical protein
VLRHFVSQISNFISEHSIFRIVTSNGHPVAAQEAVQDFCHLPT